MVRCILLLLALVNVAILAESKALPASDEDSTEATQYLVDEIHKALKKLNLEDDAELLELTETIRDKMGQIERIGKMGAKNYFKNRASKEGIQKRLEVVEKRAQDVDDGDMEKFWSDKEEQYLADFPTV